MARKVVLFGIRVSEILLNLTMRGSWTGLEFLSKFRVELDIPEFHAAIKDRDLPKIRHMVHRLSKVGYNPREVYHLAVRGVKGLGFGAWAELLDEALKQPSEDPRGPHNPV